MFRVLSLLLLFLGCVSVAQASDGSFNAVTSLAQSGLLLTAVLVFYFGVLVSLTPCVYPMIPITLGIIGAKSMDQPPLIGFLRSSVFVSGIAVIYMIMGYIAASSGVLFSYLMTQSWFLLGLATFFIAMGISMLGFFEIQLPAGLAGKLQAGGNRGGYVGAFLLGLVTGVVASPCGGPVLVSVLTIVATEGQAAVGVGLLAVYALGIGLLFLVLGTFPSLLQKMPKSGMWMDDVKRGLGLALIAVAFYYMYFAIPTLLFWILVVMTSLGFGVAIAIGANTRRGSPGLFYAWRTVGVVLVLTAVYSAIAQVPAALPSGRETAGLTANAGSGDTATPAGAATGTLTADGSTTGAVAVAAAQAPAGLQWLKDEPSALALAKETGKPIMLDFTADWCAACKQLERQTFSDPAVQEKLAGFVIAKIDVTELNDANTAIQRKYRVLSLPTVLFVGTDGEVVADQTLLTFERADKFLERLERVTQ